VGGGGGEGWGGGLDLSLGLGKDGQLVWGITGTVGLGASGFGHGGAITNTTVDAICGKN